MVGFHEMKDTRNKVVEMHGYLIQQRKVKFAPHQIVKYSVGAVEVI